MKADENSTVDFLVSEEPACAYFAQVEDTGKTYQYKFVPVKGGFVRRLRVSILRRLIIGLTDA